ncbi:hypothetical protein SDC9_82621 [bioreactor metagenome]|uniref:Uncharacterized protein n=1 Tax=bioreactor metagenome TaxID=1076179 RepID=A0A644Z587_9ZZZZ
MANPLFPIISPSTITRTPLIFRSLFVYPLLRSPDKPPNASIKGTVPKENANMAKAPFTGLDVPSANICIVCSGPHGMSPLSSPTTNGDECLLFILQKDFGMCN